MGLCLPYAWSSTRAVKFIVLTILIQRHFFLRTRSYYSIIYTLLLTPLTDSIWSCCCGESRVISSSSSTRINVTLKIKKLISKLVSLQKVAVMMSPLMKHSFATLHRTLRAQTCFFCSMYSHKKHGFKGLSSINFLKSLRFVIIESCIIHWQRNTCLFKQQNYK